MLLLSVGVVAPDRGSLAPRLYPLYPYPPWAPGDLSVKVTLVEVVVAIVNA